MQLFNRRILFFAVAVVLYSTLVITRLYGLSWGFPYLMHPDENNMTYAVLRLSCTSGALAECFNPHFFAYGQLPLYVSYLLSRGLALIGFDALSVPLRIAYSLRLIAALSSIATGVFLVKIVQKELKRPLFALLALGFFIFTPGIIQQAHFGTTESLLTLFLVMMVYFRRSVVTQAVIAGMAIATKPSALVFVALPIYEVVRHVVSSHRTISRRHLAKSLWHGVFVIFLSAIVTLLFSPHYLISLKEFISSMRYESAVATGALRVFYTRQFEGAVAILFQLRYILPYALGYFVLAGGIIGLAVSIKQRRKYPMWYVFALLIFLVSNIFLYAKWTRFVTPALPLFIYFTMVLFHYLYRRYVRLRRFFVLVLAGGIIYQFFIGVMMMSIYFRSDTRVVATEWVLRNIPATMRVVTESANVVDVPLEESNRYQYKSIFLYDIDSNSSQAKEVRTLLQQADYVIVPSRRVFANYTCFQPIGEQIREVLTARCALLKKQYPQINDYYQALLRGKQFKHIKTITPYPVFRLLNISFKWFDEVAEETWSVFDHPTVRIYERIKQ